MSKALEPKAIESALEDLEGWSYSDDKIHREYSFGSFREAMSFLVRIAFEAEAMNHHPEIFNVYSTVKISLNTHDADNKVTKNDLELAKRIEDIVWL